MKFPYKLKGKNQKLKMQVKSKKIDTYKSTFDFRLELLTFAF